MSNQETRERLIAIIKQHQLERRHTKLSVKLLSQSAGISRQAFNRYYADLKDYASGKLPISRLLLGDHASLNEIIENKDEQILRLVNELKTARLSHKAELQAVVKNHLSTLMNNDITAFEADQVSATLTGQGNHNAYLSKRITDLEIKNIKLNLDLVTAEAADASSPVEKSDKNFIIFELDLSNANKLYAVSNNFNEYENTKENELSKIIKKIKKLPNPESIDILFFQDKYLSDFKLFCNRLYPTKSRTLITIRLPIYSQEELKFIMKDLIPITSFSIYVPFSPSDAITVAKRKFSFRDIPPEELKIADDAKTPSITWGFESIHINRIKQGD
ncbi:hypothetical protein ACX3YC_26475 [Pseudomonas mohnii]